MSSIQTGSLRSGVKYLTNYRYFIKKLLYFLQSSRTKCGASQFPLGVLDNYEPASFQEGFRWLGEFSSHLKQNADIEIQKHILL